MVGGAADVFDNDGIIPSGNIAYVCMKYVGVGGSQNRIPFLQDRTCLLPVVVPNQSRFVVSLDQYHSNQGYVLTTLDMPRETRGGCPVYCSTARLQPQLFGTFCSH